MASIDMPLNGKILLITGGASGIGLALAKKAHSLGARVLVADIQTTPDFDEFAANKEGVIYVQADVTRWSDFTKIFNLCEKKWNDVPDAYAICAGVFEPPFSNFWLDTEDDGYKQVEINVSHPVKLTRLAIKKSLGKGKRASVCIIASIAGLAGNLAVPLYCATKHAVVGFVKSLRDSEPLTGVKVTTICPGIVDTPLITPEKTEQFSVTAETGLSADSVANHMLDLIQSKDHPCGTVLELTLDGARTIPDWNVSPPVSRGSGQELEVDDAKLKAMLQPVQKKLQEERSSSGTSML